MSYLKSYIQKHPAKFYDYNDEKIPVFLHIPKCAGTFTLSLISELLRAHSCFIYKQAPLEHMITFNVVYRGHVYMRVYATDAVKFSRTYAKHTYHTIELENFIELYTSNEISVFAIAVTAEILKVKNPENLSILLGLLNKEYLFFTNLRTSYSRAFSMYKVHKRSQRKMNSFTLAHDKYSLEEFGAFLNCEDSEPSWITQYLTCVFQKNKNSALNFSEKDLSAALYIDSLSQIKKIFSAIYGKYLTDYLDFLPEDVKQFNKRDNVPIYRPDDLAKATIEKYKILHKEDIALIKELLPPTKYDITESCIIEELNASIKA